MRRTTQAVERSRRPPAPRRGHCVVCSAEGSGEHDFICGECGDPLGVTMYCMSCGRRLALDPEAASALLRENGYRLDDLSGVVMKVTRCSRCMSDHETVEMSIFRLRFG